MGENPRTEELIERFQFERLLRQGGWCAFSVSLVLSKAQGGAWYIATMSGTRRGKKGKGTQD